MAKLPCPPELWPTFSALLDEALDVPEGERSQWLATLGAEHANIRPWLARVLNTGAVNFDTWAVNDTDLSDTLEAQFKAGQLVGPYQLKSRLGSGGMGEVWLASRADGTLTREIALKLPHAHLLVGVVRRRFERERNILAVLSHPHIAQLYDAGVDDAENPYLAMEFVDGVPINEYCLTQKLSLDRRIDLFLQILEAVSYAHRHLIAHRDLKPSNILVTREERIKLLDFGIAKLLDRDAPRGATEMTQVGSCIATPAYAAPEQLAGEPITAAVDLYALGVILHELLTGQRPFYDIRKGSVDRVDAGRASSRIESGHAQSVGGLNTSQLRRALTGDLDAIIAKSLDADPNRRYRSAELFADDIQRSRHHLPIAARQISKTALALKYVRRHWIGTSMAATFLLLIIGSAALIEWQALRAEREARRATTIKDFLIGIFRANDPRVVVDKSRGEMTARSLLDASAARLESSFPHEPDTQIELLGVTADIYRELEETKRSRQIYARETELAGRYHGDTDTHFIDGLLGQADAADTDGDDASALKLLSQADPLIHRASLDHSVIRARWLLIRGESLFGDAARADEVQGLLEASAALFKSVAPSDPRYSEALIDLGSLFLDRSMYSLAADYYQRAITVTEANAQPEGVLLSPYAGLALARRRLGDFPGAATAFLRGTEIAEHTYGRNTQRYWRIASDFAQFRYERGERDAAFSAFDALLDDLPKGPTPSFRNATDAMEASNVLRKYGYCAAIDGQAAHAVELLERAETLQTRPAPRAYAYGRFQLSLASAYEAAGRIADAQTAFTAALADWRAQNASPANLASALERWGQFVLSQNDLPRAAAAFDEVLEKSEGHDTEAAVRSTAGLAAIAVARGDPRSALALSSRAMNALAHIEGYYDIRIQPYVWGVRAQSLFLAGDHERARELARKASEAAAAYYSQEAPALKAARDFLRKVAAAV